VRGYQRANREQKWKSTDCSHRDEIAKGIVVQLLVYMWEQRHLIPRCERQNGAVRFAALQGFQRDAPSGAGPVIDDERWRVTLQVLGKQSRDHVQ
jgi:hypothetical protein